MENKTKNKIIAAIIIIALFAFMILGICSSTGCSEASRVNHNISKQADYFDIERKIIVYNARTDKVIFEAEGFMSVTNNDHSELVITCKTGPNEYKKNYIYLNDYTLYAVEDINGAHTDPYHYVWYLHTEVLPEVQIKP